MASSFHFWINSYHVWVPYGLGTCQIVYTNGWWGVNVAWVIFSNASVVVFSFFFFSGRQCCSDDWFVWWCTTKFTSFGYSFRRTESPSAYQFDFIKGLDDLYPCGCILLLKLQLICQQSLCWKKSDEFLVYNSTLDSK